MTRWNISHIFFLSAARQRRDVVLQPNAVNIITGASGTGKSTLIKAIDYTLGSRKCELPAHVRRRCLAVGVKWTDGESEIVVGRLVPRVGQDSSSRMFTSSGRRLPLPLSVDEFEGATTVEAAKAFLERAFGIGDLPGEPGVLGYARGRATVRHVTPYMFVTKEVIYSESVLLHGLERADKARDIIATMPYFLRVTDEASAIDERRLRRLLWILDKEEARDRATAARDSTTKQLATRLLEEAYRVGLSSAPAADWTEAQLLAKLGNVSRMDAGSTGYPGEDELGAFHSKRRDILGALSSVRRASRATRAAIRDASGFETAVFRQREKLMLATHLRLEEVSGTCPICDSPSELGRDTARMLSATLLTVREEGAAVERVKPRLIEHEISLDAQIEGAPRYGEWVTGVDSPPT